MHQAAAALALQHTGAQIIEIPARFRFGDEAGNIIPRTLDSSARLFSSSGSAVRS